MNRREACGAASKAINFVPWVIAAATLLLGGCATRPVNPPLAQYDSTYGYRALNWQSERGDPEFGLVVAMSGGGTRAAAFSYGVLPHDGACGRGPGAPAR